MLPLRMSGISDHIIIDCAVHSHPDCFQLIYCQGGKGEIELNGEWIQAQKGHMYFSPPMTTHGMRQKGGLRLGEIKVIIDDKNLYEAARLLPKDVDVDGNPLLAASMREILREGLSDWTYCYEVACSSLLVFLFRLLRVYKIPLTKRAEKYYAISDYRKEIDLLAVTEYIERHLCEQITLEKLAETVHFSTSYLSSRFKERWGVPLMQYVNSLRIEKAKQMLLVSEETVSEIAQAVGFNSLHYFSRFFKQKVGVSPNAYRLAAKKKKEAP